ncbi:hypothetical protein E5D57_004749 [Metarhizium anisopliae]|nr:hypothetical protein E5D57_004749 [Metarhizium anisopliae]
MNISSTYAAVFSITLSYHDKMSLAAYWHQPDQTFSGLVGALALFPPHTTPGLRRGSTIAAPVRGIEGAKR